MVLEICAGNYISAVNAQDAGAHRIELCSELAVGGITPSFGLLKHVLDALTIPVFVLIRPRSGNFTYSEAEFDIMKRNIELCKNLGCNGIVSGILNPNQTIDIERTKELVELSKPLPFTFHRAFDWTPDGSIALNQLIDLNINRVLTSGQSPSAEIGIKVLKELKGKANNNIVILPGSGIHSENVALFKSAGFKEIHASASTQNIVNAEPKIKMNSTKLCNETTEYYSNKENIAAILKRISNE